MSEVPQGLYTAMVTPLGRNGNVDHGLLDEYLEFQRAGGIDGVVVCGTNGEGPSLSISERKALLEAVLARRGNLGVIAGTGAAALPDAVELTRHAALAGADLVLILPPFYFKNPSVAGLAAWFRAVLDVAEVPALLYNIPHQSAVPITDELVARLAGHSRLRGLKDSAGNWEATRAVICSHPDLSVYTGADELLFRSLSGGGAGAISGTANGFPELLAGVRRAMREPGGCEQAQERLNRAKSILMEYPLIAASKSVLAHRGVGRMWVRQPLVDLTEAQEREMIARMREAGLL